MNISTTMQSKVESYLAERRQAGFALTIAGQQLLSFARFADSSGHKGPLTLKLAIVWANASEVKKPLTAARRIEVLRSFARYCQQFEPDIEIPPLKLFGRAHRRLAPHIYTDSELAQLLSATEQLFSSKGLRRACVCTLLGLIASSGLRLSEATGLLRADVDLQNGLLHIRNGKFGKSRWVPLHSTTTRALQDYSQKRDSDSMSAGTEAFFVSDYGRPAKPRDIGYAFNLLRRKLQWKPRGGHPAPRIHDLRHTFICRRLLQWYEEGLDIDRNILALSTYVGHAKVTDTYWYVTATPELMAIAAQRFEHYVTGEKL